MNIAILSVTDNAKLFYDKLQYTASNYHAVCFVEEYCNAWGTQYQGTETVSIGKALELYQNRMVEKFVIISMEERFNKSMYQTLTDLHVLDEDILYADLEDIHSQGVLGSLSTYIDRQEFDTIEFHVADICNMNCKYCSMFSGLVCDNSFPNVQQYENDLLQIKKCFRSIKRIKLLGGEPLLNPELDRFIEISRSVFPYAAILVVTNGLLVTAMNRKRIDCIRNNDAEIVVSYYRSLGSKIEDIHQLLKKEHIRHRVTSCITQFYKMYDLSGKQNASHNFEVCGCREGCATLCNSQLMSCFVPSIIRFADANFNLGFTNEDGIDLYQEELTRDLIRQNMKKPLAVCKYCLLTGISVEWQQMDRDSLSNIYDWSI